MRSCFQSALFACAAGLAFVWLAALPPAASADQIVCLIDEHGHKVYINTGDPRSPANGGTAHAFRPTRKGPSPPPEEIDRLVRQAATHSLVDPKLVHAIIQTESDYDPNAVSNKGAMGLMQLIPATAQRFGVENPFDPKQNIEGGVSYLRHLLDLFSGDLTLSLAAYNAGENSVLRSGGVPDFTETKSYVRKVSNLYGSPTVPNGEEQKPKEPPKAPIYRYVDADGVAHYTNGYEF
ncbi:MAG: lytic transglycosylase domain-containing protein [Acidobacteriia bacterium]|nr:lytic transglycosylase domain-containing protein [Terriglobia bacterium]